MADPAEQPADAGAAPATLTAAQAEAMRNLIVHIYSRWADTDHDHSKVFQRMVNKRMFADYYDLIKEPIALSTVKQRVNADEYASFAPFVRDLALISHNAFVYNRRGSDVYQDAEILQKEIQSQLQKLVASGVVTAEEAAPPDLGEIPEDDDEEEEEEEEEDEGEEDEEEEEEEEEEESNDEDEDASDDPSATPPPATTRRRNRASSRTRGLAPGAATPTPPVSAPLSQFANPDPGISRLQHLRNMQPLLQPQLSGSRQPVPPPPHHQQAPAQGLPPPGFRPGIVHHLPPHMAPVPQHYSPQQVPPHMMRYPNGAPVPPGPMQHGYPPGVLPVPIPQHMSPHGQMPPMVPPHSQFPPMQHPPIHPGARPMVPQPPPMVPPHNQFPQHQSPAAQPPQMHTPFHQQHIPAHVTGGVPTPTPPPPVHHQPQQQALPPTAPVMTAVTALQPSIPAAFVLPQEQDAMFPPEVRASFSRAADGRVLFFSVPPAAGPDGPDEPVWGLDGKKLPGHSVEYLLKKEERERMRQEGEGAKGVGVR